MKPSAVDETWDPDLNYSTAFVQRSARRVKATRIMCALFQLFYFTWTAFQPSCHNPLQVGSGLLHYTEYAAYVSVAISNLLVRTHWKRLPKRNVDILLVIWDWKRFCFFLIMKGTKHSHGLLSLLCKAMIGKGLYPKLLLEGGMVGSSHKQQGDQELEQACVVCLFFLFVSFFCLFVPLFSILMFTLHNKTKKGDCDNKPLYQIR